MVQRLLAFLTFLLLPGCDWVEEWEPDGRGALRDGHGAALIPYGNIEPKPYGARPYVGRNALLEVAIT